MTVYWRTTKSFKHRLYHSKVKSPVTAFWSTCHEMSIELTFLPPHGGHKLEPQCLEFWLVPSRHQFASCSSMQLLKSVSVNLFDLNYNVEPHLLPMIWYHSWRKLLISFLLFHNAAHYLELIVTILCRPQMAGTSTILVAMTRMAIVWNLASMSIYTS